MTGSKLIDGPFVGCIYDSGEIAEKGAASGGYLAQLIAHIKAEMLIKSVPSLCVYCGSCEISQKQLCVSKSIITRIEFNAKCLLQTCKYNSGEPESLKEAAEDIKSLEKSSKATGQYDSW